MKNKRCGFTLIEMMVTISIILIITSSAVPGVNQQIKNYKFNNEIRDVLTLMNDVRSEAITLKKDLKVHYSKKITDQNNETDFYWSAQNAQIYQVDHMEFDMLGRVKQRPTHGYIAITHQWGTSFSQVFSVNILGTLNPVPENTTC